MTATTPRSRGRPWGRLALVLSMLAWAGLLGAGLAFVASVGAPGDGNHGIRAMQFWILGGVITMVAGFLGSLAALVLAWRRRSGVICASIAGALLVLLLSLVLIVAGATAGPLGAVNAAAIWQVTGSRG